MPSLVGFLSFKMNVCISINLHSLLLKKWRGMFINNSCKSKHPPHCTYQILNIVCLNRMTRMKRMNKSKNNYLRSLSLMLKGAWWMKNFSSLPNKHRDAVGRLEEQKTSFFQRTEADTSNPCFQRYSPPHLFV